MWTWMMLRRRDNAILLTRPFKTVEEADTFDDEIVQYLRYDLVMTHITGPEPLDESKLERVPL